MRDAGRCTISAAIIYIILILFTAMMGYLSNCSNGCQKILAFALITIGTLGAGDLILFVKRC